MQSGNEGKIIKGKKYKVYIWVKIIYNQDKMIVLKRVYSN